MKSRSVQAFTIVEIVVGLAITSMLVVLMLQIFSVGTTAWQRNDEKLDTFRESRAALEAMARDFTALSPALAAPNKFPVLALDWHPDTKAEDRVNQEIYGLLRTRNRGRGDLCAVGYYCVWDETKKAFALKRQCTESNTTFNLLQSFATAAATPATAFSGEQVFRQLFMPMPQPSTVQSIDDMATYVWDLQVDIAEEGTPPVKVAWPQGFYSRQLPPWVEIRFKALGSTAARKIPAKGVTRQTWFPTNESVTGDKDIYDRYIRPAEQQFAIRIKLCR